LIGSPEICMNCGAKPRKGTSFCHACGTATTPSSEICMKCGARMGKAIAEDIRRQTPTTGKPGRRFFKAICRKENRKKLIVSTVGVLLVVMTGSLVLYSINANKPQPEIISHNLRTDVIKTGEGWLDYDYVYVIDATVMNKGKAGTVTVWAKVNQDTNLWQKSQTILLNHDEQEQVQFTFSEPEFAKEFLVGFLEGYLGIWKGYDYDYKVWAEVP